MLCLCVCVSVFIRITKCLTNIPQEFKWCHQVLWLSPCLGTALPLVGFIPPAHSTWHTPGWHILHSPWLEITVEKSFILAVSISQFQKWILIGFTRSTCPSLDQSPCFEVYSCIIRGVTCPLQWPMRPMRPVWWIAHQNLTMCERNRFSKDGLMTKKKKKRMPTTTCKWSIKLWWS